MTSEEEREFLKFVKEHRAIGYGRMMQLISGVWYKSLEQEREGAGGGALVGTTCLAQLPTEEYQAFHAVLQADEESGLEF
jgi:hypothetical protein